MLQFISLVVYVVSHIHFSNGPYGFVFYAWPNDHVSLGVGLIRDHLTGWFETQ